MGSLVGKPQDLRPVALFRDSRASAILHRSHGLFEGHWLTYRQPSVVVQSDTCTTAEIETTAILDVGLAEIEASGDCDF